MYAIDKWGHNFHNPHWPSLQNAIEFNWSRFWCTLVHFGTLPISYQLSMHLATLPMHLPWFNCQSVCTVKTITIAITETITITSLANQPEVEAVKIIPAPALRGLQSSPQYQTARYKKLLWYCQTRSLVYSWPPFKFWRVLPLLKRQ